MSDVILKRKDGTTQTFTGVDTVRLKNARGEFDNNFIIPAGTKKITQNGITDVTRYASVNVDVGISDIKEGSIFSTTVHWSDVYLNVYKSPSEIQSVLSQLPSGNYYIYVSQNTLGDYCTMYIGTDHSSLHIVYSNSDFTQTYASRVIDLLTGGTVKADDFGSYGAYKASMAQSFYKPLTTFAGSIVGTQNELIKNIVSSTPFVYDKAQTLAKPIAYVDGNILTTSTSQNTRAFAVYVDGVEKVEVPYLSMLNGYDLTQTGVTAAGSHSVTIKALSNISYYEESALSAAATWTIEESKLPTPILSLSGSVVSVTNYADTSAYNHILFSWWYKRGTEASGQLAYGNITSLDLSNYFETELATAGTYEITVRVSADNYIISDTSEAIEYVVEPEKLTKPIIAINSTYPNVIEITNNVLYDNVADTAICTWILENEGGEQYEVTTGNEFYIEWQKALDDKGASTMFYTVTVSISADNYSDSDFADPVQVEYSPSIKENPYITFTGENGDFTLSATKEWDGTVEYSTDTTLWTAWDGSEISSADGKLYLRGSGNTKFYTSTGARFKLSQKAACSGNIQTLLQYDNPPISIPRTQCYYEMFFNCQNLTRAPELPATTLAVSCYGEMFNACTNLTQAPELPATTLAANCYYAMFFNCANLTQAPELPATTLADYCYGGMFFNCTNLTQAPELPATTLAANCYYAMFNGCTNLTQAPELPATTLADSCYYAMFEACTNLKLSTTQTDEYITPYRIPTTGNGTTATDALTNMFYHTGGTFTGTPEINTTYYGAWGVEPLPKLSAPTNLSITDSTLTFDSAENATSYQVLADRASIGEFTPTVQKTAIGT